MSYIVYKTTNLINDRFYVGVHNSKSDSYLGSGRLLHAAINKYGKQNFKREILIECDDAEEAYSIEAILVKTVLEDPRSYNIEPGGFGNSNLGAYVVKNKIGIHAATFEQRSNWQKERIKNTPIEKLRKNSSVGGKKCSELGKSGFLTATHEQRILNSQKANATKLERGYKSLFANKEFQSEMGKRGGKAHGGTKTYNDGEREYKFFSSNKQDVDLTLNEFTQFLQLNPQFKSGRIFRQYNRK